MASTQFPSYTLDDIIAHHKSIAQEICSRVNPLDYFPGYLHHGYYPFFLDKANFSENLVKNINMIMEVDILLIKQIELSYLPKVRAVDVSVVGTVAGSHQCEPVEQGHTDFEGDGHELHQEFERRPPHQHALSRG